MESASVPESASSASVLASAAVGAGGGAAATVCPDWPADASCGVRSDSLATTMVIAAARTASPATCPPIRRESSGNEDAVDVALATFRFPRRPGVAGVLLGVTTGNRLVMLLGGVTEVPGSPGAVVGIEPVTGGGDGAELVSLSTVDTAASAGDRAPPDGGRPEP